jgi:hypothetical protein
MFDLKGKYEHVFLSILNKYIYALIRSSTEHKLFMYLTSSIIIKRHKHQIFWDQPCFTSSFCFAENTTFFITFDARPSVQLTPTPNPGVVL